MFVRLTGQPNRSQLHACTPSAHGWCARGWQTLSSNSYVVPPMSPSTWYPVGCISFVRLNSVSAKRCRQRECVCACACVRKMAQTKIHTRTHHALACPLCHALTRTLPPPPPPAANSQPVSGSTTAHPRSDTDVMGHATSVAHVNSYSHSDVSPTKTRFPGRAALSHTKLMRV